MTRENVIWLAVMQVWSLWCRRSSFILNDSFYLKGEEFLNLNPGFQITKTPRTCPVGLNHALLQAGPTLPTLSPLVTSDRPNSSASHLAICPANVNVTPNSNKNANSDDNSIADTNTENIASVKCGQKRLLEDPDFPCSKLKRLNQCAPPIPLHDPTTFGESPSLNPETPEATPIVLHSDDDAISHAGKQPLFLKPLYYPCSIFSLNLDSIHSMFLSLGHELGILCS
jgi:hypothetical protein